MKITIEFEEKFIDALVARVEEKLTSSSPAPKKAVEKKTTVKKAKPKVEKKVEKPKVEEKTEDNTILFAQIKDIVAGMKKHKGKPEVMAIISRLQNELGLDPKKSLVDNTSVNLKAFQARLQEEAMKIEEEADKMNQSDVDFY